MASIKNESGFVEVHKRIKRSEVDVTDYLPLINKILHKMSKRYGQYVFEIQDELIQEGYVGLLTAKKDYDPKRGTFVTLGWLRISTYMVRALNKASREFVRMNHLEDLEFPSTYGSGEQLTWQDMFPSNQIDINTIARLSVKDNVDWLILDAITSGMTRRMLPKHLGITVRETESRLKILREEMVAVCNEMYEGGK